MCADEREQQAGDEQHAPFRVGAASAAYTRPFWESIGATIQGRHLFDRTNGWEAEPPAGEHLLVVSHRPKPDGWHPEADVPFPPGSALLLYTDGLVESRTRDLTLNIDRLAQEVVALHGMSEVDDALDRIVAELTQGETDDDVAVLHVRNVGA